MNKTKIEDAHQAYTSTQGTQPDIVFLSRPAFHQLIESERTIGVPSLSIRRGDWLIKDCMVILVDGKEPPLYFASFAELHDTIHNPSGDIPYVIQVAFKDHFTLNSPSSHRYKQLLSRKPVYMATPYHPVKQPPFVGTLSMQID